MNSKQILRHIGRLNCVTFRYQSQETHFGFEQVDVKEKQAKVNHVFTNVASKYDLMNDVMSIGVHRCWKNYFVNKMSPLRHSQCLDVAGGTGDIAFRMIESYKKELQKRSGISELGVQKEAEFGVTVCDINTAMMEVGTQRAEERGMTQYVDWKEGNAEKLPMSDNSFDIYTIAFGIRNCTDVQQVLNEAFRVLKPYGRFMCLEFSEVDNILLKMLYDNYSFQAIPVMGQLIAGDWRSYQYLVESIRQFPKQIEFQLMIESAGFRSVSFENLTNGVACIHSGFKLP